MHTSQQAQALLKYMQDHATILAAKVSTGSDEAYQEASASYAFLSTLVNYIRFANRPDTDTQKASHWLNLVVLSKNSQLEYLNILGEAILRGSESSTTKPTAKQTPAYQPPAPVREPYVSETERRLVEEHGPSGSRMYV